MVDLKLMSILVDDIDVHWLEDGYWSIHKYGNGLYYASGNLPGSSKTRYLHRVIMGEPEDMEVDHRNGNGLDNRRRNLRITSHALNQANQRPQVGKSSPFKGVSWHRISKRWHASIKVDGKKRHLGSFLDELEAAHAYDLAATEVWGEFARPNLPKAESEVA